MANQTKHGAPGEVVVALRQVTKYFDSLWGGNLRRALTDVSFEVRCGEIFGLLGPARAGKSTTLKLIAGQLKPLEGTVKVFGRSPRSRAAKARTASLLEQGRVRGVLAQALASRPDLVLLDEPFAGLEMGARRELEQLLRSLAGQGKTVILSSQHLEEIQDLCDRVAVFDAGKVEAVATVAELLATPAALRWLAPVVSATVSEYLLEVLREQLKKADSADQSPFSATAPVTSRQAGAPPADPAAAAADEILAHLIKPVAPVTPSLRRSETDSIPAVSKAL